MSDDREKPDKNMHPHTNHAHKIFLRGPFVAAASCELLGVCCSAMADQGMLSGVDRE